MSKAGEGKGVFGYSLPVAFVFFFTATKLIASGSFLLAPFTTWPGKDPGFAPQPPLSLPRVRHEGQGDEEEILPRRDQSQNTYTNAEMKRMKKKSSQKQSVIVVPCCAVLYMFCA